MGTRGASRGVILAAVATLCILGTLALPRSSWALQSDASVGSTGCGESWQMVTLPPLAYPQAVTWTGRLLVAVGAAGTILTSTDGLLWTSHNWSTDVDLYGVTSTGTQLVAIGGTHWPMTPVVLTSPDGSAWTAHDPGVGRELRAVAWSGSLLAAVDDSGAILTSPNGVAWTLRVPGTEGLNSVYSPLYAVIWTGAQFVAAGTWGNVLMSQDGMTWTHHDAPYYNQLTGIAWTGSQFVAVGQVQGSPMGWIGGETIVTSPDGVAWTERGANDFSGPILRGVTWTGSDLVAVGSSIMTSPDGVTWRQQVPPDSVSLMAITSTGSQLVAVGSRSAALSPCSSPCVPPAITSQATSVSVGSGQSATLSVTASGTPPLSYQWYQGPSGATFFPVGTNSRTFTTPSLTSLSSYWVRVSNACGHADSPTANVTVGCAAPTITAQPQSLTSARDGSVTLSVSATGALPLTYQWYEGSVGDTSTPVGTGSTTFVTPLLGATTTYWVRITNACGSADSTAATVTVEGGLRRRIGRLP